MTFTIFHQYELQSCWYVCSILAVSGRFKHKVKNLTVISQRLKRAWIAHQVYNVAVWQILSIQSTMFHFVEDPSVIVIVSCRFFNLRLYLYSSYFPTYLPFLYDSFTFNSLNFRNGHPEQIKIIITIQLRTPSSPKSYTSHMHNLVHEKWQKQHITYVLYFSRQPHRTWLFTHTKDDFY